METINRHILVSDLDNTTVGLDPVSFKVEVIPAGVNNHLVLDKVAGVLEMRSPDGTTVVDTVKLAPVYGINQFLGWNFPAPTVAELVAKVPPTVDVKNQTTGEVIGKAWAADAPVSAIVSVEVKDQTTGTILYKAMASSLADAASLVKITAGADTHYVVKV